MRKHITYIIVMVIAITFLTGCEREIVETKNLEVLDNMNENSLSFTKELEGIEFSTEYSAGNYDIGKWLITDSKTLNMNLNIKNLPEGSEVFVEHVHADVSIASRDAQLNGMPQDSMDDSYHAYGQDGFHVTMQYPYKEVFAIEGYSDTLINGWSWYCGSYGRGTISTERLTEKTLVKEGLTFGNKIQVIYNLNIRHAGETYFHTNVIKDEFYIKTTYTDPKDKEE